MEAAVATLVAVGDKQAKLDQLKAEAQAKLDDFLLKNRKQGRPTVAVALRKRILSAAISRLERGFLPNESAVQTKKPVISWPLMRGATHSTMVRRRSCSHQVAPEAPGLGTGMVMMMTMVMMTHSTMMTMRRTQRSCITTRSHRINTLSTTVPRNRT